MKNGMVYLFWCILCTFGGLASAQNFTEPRRAGAGQSMNPDISVNALTLYKNARRDGATKYEPGGGFSLQEVEMQFLADVDPYLRASALLSVHPVDIDPAAPPLAQPADKKFEIEPEEVFLETTSLPLLTVKAGRFHAALGRHNTLHTHAFPFIDAPLVNQKLLGGDGLTEAGVSASLLVPLPWYMECIAQGLQGDSPALFASGNASAPAQVYRMRNLFDLTDSATLDLGLSGARGPNFYNQQTTVKGADLTFKWRPTKGGKYTALILASEYLQGEVKGRPDDSKLSGYAAWVQYQWAERWWVEARNEEVDASVSGTKQRKNSLLLAFFPSEFSGFRLQVDQLSDDRPKALQTVWLQGNFTIGAHPAHSY